MSVQKLIVSLCYIVCVSDSLHNGIQTDLVIRFLKNLRQGTAQKAPDENGQLQYTPSVSTIILSGRTYRLQIRIDHKMFDMFTSRNVKKKIKYPLSRPTTTTMSDQIVGLKNLRQGTAQKAPDENGQLQYTPSVSTIILSGRT
jgi:hypothetical protein